MVDGDVGVYAGVGVADAPLPGEEAGAADGAMLAKPEAGGAADLAGTACA